MRKLVIIQKQWEHKVEMLSCKVCGTKFLRWTKRHRGHKKGILERGRVTCCRRCSIINTTTIQGGNNDACKH